MKRRRRELTCALLVVAGCGGLLGSGPAVALAGATESDLAAVVVGNTQFALDLYAQLRTNDGNLLLSPYSISTALAMTYAGARNETAQQMADVLHFSLGQERLHSAFAALMASVRTGAGQPGCRLDVANALWSQRGYGFLDEFLALNKQHYGAGLRELDFEHATEQARQAISAWVDSQTQHRIRELLRQGDLNAATVLALTNAIYFKGDWAIEFDKWHTQDGPFWIGDQQQVVVPLMHAAGKLAFAATDQLDVLELPYQGGRLSMVLLLPKERDGLAAVEQSLSTANLERWLGQLRERPVRVTLPRFKLDFRADLARALQALGMTDAFSPQAADFSGMIGRRGIWIDMLIHQAQVDVNEEGSEAAAATAVALKRGPVPPAFVADHAFLFLIRDKQTGSILFMGRVVNPKL